MGKWRSRGFCLAVAILSLWSLPGCGGSKPGSPIYPGKVNLTPATNTSLILGSTLTFTASATTTSGTNIKTTFTYSSSDTAILNMAPNGVACAGHWDISFAVCTPGGTGVVLVTASALGATSVPTYVFVHPPIDNITVTGILLTGQPIQEPCLSQSQTMTLEAHAFSQGTDITTSVGPFTWTADNTAVVSLNPLVNTAYNFATNQVTATAATPGLAHIYATASGVTSTTFQQPQYTNAAGTTSPTLDFFSTCPIQSINLEVGAIGTGQTSFVTSKGTSQQIYATITDVMGNSSLPNSDGAVVLTKVPLTWTSSQPGVLPVGTSCTQSCTTSTPSPGSGTLSASCSPPSCNVGFPFVPATLSTPSQITACTQFFQPSVPNPTFGCQQLIPVPVYASSAISGVVTGAPLTTSLFATSTGCDQVIPTTCSTAGYYFATAKQSVGGEDPLPVAPTSVLFDLGGDKLYMGSNFGAEVVNPNNLGTSNNAFSSLSPVTGNVLAVSNNGTSAAFSNTANTPNQLFVVNTANSNSLSFTPLSIPTASAAAYSPDGLKTFIVGGGGTSLYVYSPLQSLQGPTTLTGAANSVTFSPNGAFAYVAEAANGTASANVTAYAACNNSLAATVAIPNNPILMKVLPNLHIDGKDSYGNAIPDGVHVLVLDSTGFDIITSAITAPATGALCPQSLTFVSNDPLRPAQRLELGQGPLQPVNFFASYDGSQLYVASASSSSIFIYNFIIGSVIGGIQLIDNATPLGADITIDDGTILIAGSDGRLHEVSTSLGGSDLVQLTFPNLPDYLNPFCNYSPASGPCTFNVIAVKP